ncbi:MAG: permease [Anaerolineales bacterium]|uniref:permease n=1 Tax=Candidatus Villigracilis affinis TaxID=3140682 RepID=UPI001B6C119A|nr:permease [Anaerolineales bacterium]MBK9603959.1 permease [Anaerolineales bacterium]MBL0347456.1 permease [Anaerolineales bacterium]MBP8047601.1 permease [Anaerolineales bacterium]
MQNTTSSPRLLSRTSIITISLVVLSLVVSSMLPAGFFALLWDRLNVFATVFLGIFVEAVPYLLLGTLASGLVEVFLDRDQMSRWISHRPVAAAVGGAFMGMIFPVCECGVVPLTRRLFNKGLPLSAGIAFLLAAPVLNPIVVLSTASAFGWGQMLLWRMGVSLIIAVVVGLVFSVEQNAANVLRPVLTSSHDHDHSLEANASFSEKMRRALLVTADEFFEMGRYLIIGAMLAAALQTFVPQSSLLAIGSGPVTSVLVMLALAILLSICSTVDAFVALGFLGTFSFGSVLSFLVFGPMVDIKSIIMYLQVFRRRSVAYIVAIPFLMSLLAGILFNYLQP